MAALAESEYHGSDEVSQAALAESEHHSSDDEDMRRTSHENEATQSNGLIVCTADDGVYKLLGSVPDPYTQVIHGWSEYLINGWSKFIKFDVLES